VTAYFKKHGYEKITSYEPFDFVNAYYQRRAEPADTH